MIKGYCSHCGKKLPFWMKANARFCNDYCRKAYFDINKRQLNRKKANKGAPSVGKGCLL